MVFDKNLPQKAGEKEEMGLLEVVDCVRRHLQNAGFTVTTKRDPIGVNIDAVKKKETFKVEAVGRYRGRSVEEKKELLYAVGEITRRLCSKDVWSFYGVALPKSYLVHLKDFEVGGLRLLDLQFFIVESAWSLYHLDAKAVVAVIDKLREGAPENLATLDIDFKMYDYSI